MLDIKAFGEKLKDHRKNMGMTQEEVAEKIGVSGQAVSKWENGECLPDCFNLKELGEIYGISLDILLETKNSEDIKYVSAKIEQLADEFIWAKQKRDTPYVHRDLGDDLWKMWKGIYFIETGNKALQERDKKVGNLRICSEYGQKVWDEDGVTCVVKSSLLSKLGDVGEREHNIMRELCSEDGFKLISMLDGGRLTPKALLIEKSGIELKRLNELLLLFTENRIIEFVFKSSSCDGYKICAHFGIAAYMVIAAAFLLSKSNCSTSEYIGTLSVE